MLLYELVRILNKKGWTLIKHTGKQEHWTKDNEVVVVPAQDKIHKLIAKEILKKVYA